MHLRKYIKLHNVLTSVKDFLTSAHVFCAEMMCPLLPNKLYFLTSQSKHRSYNGHEEGRWVLRWHCWQVLVQVVSLTHLALHTNTSRCEELFHQSNRIYLSWLNTLLSLLKLSLTENTDASKLVDAFNLNNGKAITTTKCRSKTFTLPLNTLIRSGILKFL